jgi:hypothetical protein
MSQLRLTQLTRYPRRKIGIKKLIFFKNDLKIRIEVKYKKN